MTNKIDLHKMVDKLAKQVSKEEVYRILEHYRKWIERLPTQRERRRVSGNLVVTTIDNLDLG